MYSAAAYVALFFYLIICNQNDPYVMIGETKTFLQAHALPEIANTAYNSLVKTCQTLIGMLVKI
jgi:hypothetical protein